MAPDMELERIEDEIRRHDERRKRLIERKNRRLRQIREKQLKDKEVWTRKLIPLLDKTLEERFGELYWYRNSAEDICAGMGQIKVTEKSTVIKNRDEKD